MWRMKMWMIAAVLSAFPALKTVGGYQIRKSGSRPCSDSDHQIVFPLKKIIRAKRSDTSTQTSRTAYDFFAYNRTFNLELEPLNGLFSPSFHTLTFGEDAEGSILKIDRARHLRNCFYKGKIRDDTDSTVSLNACNGLFGLIHTCHGDYRIEPVFRSNLTTAHRLHRTQNDPTGCEKKGSKRGISSPSDVGSLGDRSSSRTKRSVSQEWNLEMLVVADSKMRRYHGDNLEMYIFTLLASVALIYKDPSIGNNINITVVKLIIMKEGQDSGVIFPSASKTLRNFCRWQQQLNDPNSDGLHHDTAILLTREDLCRQSKTCDTLGLAQSGMVCDRRSSCAVIEDNGLSAAFTIAHELGHILGVPHDDDKKCSRHREQGQKVHVMARMLDYNSHPWTWSECSRHYITTFLDSGYGYCLLNKSLVDKLSSFEHVATPPGELYDMDYQCQLVFGQGSKICPYMPVCKRLWCTMVDITQGGCRTQHMPWADGTKCGPDKSCLHGECVHEQLPVFPPQDGQWGEWQNFGSCSRPCGGGIMNSIRECDNPRPKSGGRYCVGDRVRYKSCNTEECPPTSHNFREQQCAAFNGKTFGFPGVPSNVKWLPHYSGSEYFNLKSVEEKESCKLFCRVAGTAAYFLLKEKVIDGTSCGPDTYDLCVNGKCMSAGCDHKLESKKVVDVCGMCGGNGTTCKIIQGRFTNVQYGYNPVVMIPSGASNIEILQFGHGSMKDDNYLALKDADNMYILNGDSMISMFPKILHYAGTILEYSGSDSIVERINCTKPLQRNLYVQVLAVGSLHPPSILFNYTVSLLDQSLYYWRLEKNWSQCNNVCQGEQYIKAICVSRHDDSQIVSDGHCQEQERPKHLARVCNPECTLSWNVKQLVPCSSSCGKGVILNEVTCIQHLQSRAVHEIPAQFCAHLKPHPEKQVSCIGLCQSTAWKYGEWSQCSVTCGGGLQFRYTVCLGNDAIELPDSACNASLKITEQSCALDTCPEWDVGKWQECSVTCGLGISSRTIKCISSEGEAISSLACDISKKPNNTKACEKPCKMMPVAFPHSPKKVLENMVPSIPVSLDEDFSMNTIVPIWKVGDWSQCSVTCGDGLRQRRITCYNSLNGRNLPEKKCKRSDHPLQAEVCYLPSCGQWMGGEWSKCSVTCGEGIQIRKSVCILHDNQQVEDKLCDLNYRPPQEQLCRNSHCPGTSRESITVPLVVHSSIENTYHWRTGSWGRCSKACGGGIRRRQVACYDEGMNLSSKCDQKKKPHDSSQCNMEKCPHWIVGDWNKCSVACGSGIQTREVICLNHKGTTVPEERCLSNPPEKEKKCLVNNCVHWSWTYWSNCSSSCGQGIQSRFPQCMRNGKTEKDIACADKQKPFPQNRSCKGVSCIYHWKKKKWSKCSTSCGKGHKYREVFCQSGNRTIVPDHFCVMYKKPVVRRKCHQYHCAFTWKVSHWSECSETCGKGHQTRTVTCHQVNAYQWINPQPIPMPAVGSQGTWCKPEEKPSHTKRCNLGYCHGPVWKPGLWLECSSQCGFGKQRRRVRCYNADGKRLKNDKCERKLRPQRKRRCYMPSCMPTSCSDHQHQYQVHKDGDQNIFFRGTSVKVFCSGMNTSTPKEYITLFQGEADNYSEIYHKRLINPETCPHRGLRYDSCDCVSDESAGAGLTTFYRIAINITSLQVLTHDFTFSQTHMGKPVAYGESGDCYSKKSCPQGRFSLNLLGTGFMVSSDTKWISQGNHATSSIRWLEGGRVIQGKCGGYCGKCEPDSKIGILLDVAPP